MQYLPVFFDLKGLPVLVVGGGEVALRKVSLLERAGAAIRLVAPALNPELAQRAASGKLETAVREFVPEDLEGVRLVVVATSRRAVNRWIASLCEARALPVNVVDDRDASRFIMPAIVDRDPVLLAVSTGGTSPVLARRLRERLEAAIPKRLGELAAWLQELRGASRRFLRGTQERRRYFEAVVDGAAARRFLAGDLRGARKIAHTLLAASRNSPRGAGEVVLVGAGPGDPELLTIKALRALQDADVILHDRLVPAAILDLARRDAMRICVGKTAGGPSTDQRSINEMLIDHARQGRRVVRLKGGDPMIFGRGGEELVALAGARIDFSVIPGITAATGCAAYAGIPLTHREHAHSVTFVTGHPDASNEPNWHALAMPGATVVFYMGLARLEHIAAKLIEHGAPPDRPVALIAQGTTAEQRVIAATIGTLCESAAAAGPGAPALLVVGEVAALHQTLAWFNLEEPRESLRCARPSA